MDTTSIVSLGQEFGISALLFVIFLVYNRGEQKKWIQRETNLITLYESIVAQVKDNRKDEFKLLNDTLTDNRVQLGMLKETLTHIENLSNTTQTAFHDMFNELRAITSKRCVNELNKHPHS